MKGKNILVMSIVCLLCINACKTREKSSSGGVSTDVTGIYTGMLPCADCPGIETKIELKKDLTYIMQTKYVEKSEEIFTQSGKYQWDMQKGIITFDNRLVGQCLVEGNTLTVMIDGKKPTEETTGNYVLEKVDLALVEKYWKLVELYGKPVAVNDSNAKEAHIIFKIEGNRFNGDAGCNRFAGSYHVKKSGGIVFSQTIATRMMCLNMDIETQFLQALGTADSYAVHKDTLELSKTGAPLARFVVVYLK